MKIIFAEETCCHFSPLFRHSKNHVPTLHSPDAEVMTAFCVTKAYLAQNSVSPTPVTPAAFHRNSSPRMYSCEGEISSIEIPILFVVPDRAPDLTLVVSSSNSFLWSDLKNTLAPALSGRLCPGPFHVYKELKLYMNITFLAVIQTRHGGNTSPQPGIL